MKNIRTFVRGWQILWLAAFFCGVSYSFDSTVYGERLSSDTPNFEANGQALPVGIRAGQTAADVSSGNTLPVSSLQSIDVNALSKTNANDSGKWLGIGALGALASLAVLRPKDALPPKNGQNNKIAIDFVKSDDGKTLNYYINKTAKPYEKDIKSGLKLWQDHAGIQFKKVDDPKKAKIIYNASTGEIPFEYDSDSFPQDIPNKNQNAVERSYEYGAKAVITFNKNSPVLNGEKVTKTPAQLVAHETGHAMGLADLFESGTENNIMHGITSYGDKATKGEITKEQANAVKTMQEKGPSALGAGTFGLRDPINKSMDGSAIYKDPGFHLE